MKTHPLFAEFKYESRKRFGRKKSHTSHQSSENLVNNQFLEVYDKNAIKHAQHIIDICRFPASTVQIRCSYLRAGNVGTVQIVVEFLVRK